MSDKYNKINFYINLILVLIGLSVLTIIKTIL